MDPLSLVVASAAAGGVAGKLAEKVVDYLAELLKGQDQVVQERAAENVGVFLPRLSEQLQRLESRLQMPSSQLEAALSDPDVAVALRSALIGAARSSSRAKHDSLARAVAERLVAPSETVEAVASVHAIEAIPRLSNAHLHFLGIAAITFILRPLALYAPVQRDGVVREPQAGAPYRSYCDWLREALTRHHLEVTLGELQLAHLISAGCITYERKLRRDLHSTLMAGREELIAPLAAFDCAQDLTLFLLRDPVGADLQALWEKELQHVTLTPAGSLIGVATYESGGGEPQSNSSPFIDRPIDDVVWDGSRLGERFLGALDRAVKDRAERGVGPWMDLGKGH
jgi:hypothetical protein